MASVRTSNSFGRGRRNSNQRQRDTSKNSESGIENLTPDNFTLELYVQVIAAVVKWLRARGEMSLEHFALEPRRTESDRPVLREV